MANLANWKQERKTNLDAAEGLVKAAEAAHRSLTTAEAAAVEAHMNAVASLNAKISVSEQQNTIRGMLDDKGILLTDGTTSGECRRFSMPKQVKTLSSEFASDFFAYIATAGKKIGAALYEGADSAGGFAVPIVVDNQIVPLAPLEMSVRRLASVIPTTSDVKIPTKTAFSQAALKTELSSFGSTAPTIGQFTLSAFMVGQQNDLSWELAQDVPVFQQFLVDDMVLAQQMFEDEI